MKLPAFWVLLPEENKPDQHNDQRCQEQQDRQAVDAMHVFHPLRIRRIGVPLFEVEVLCYLPPEAHNNNLKNKIKR